MISHEILKKALGGCGACHQWGYNPNMKDGKCNTCSLTEEEILEHHGYFELSEKEKKEFRYHLLLQGPM